MYAIRKKSCYAYHGDPEIKEYFIERMKSHMAADELIQGHYIAANDGVFTGCAVTCLAFDNMEVINSFTENPTCLHLG